MKDIAIQLLLLIVGAIVFLPLFVVGVLYTTFKHIWKLDYSISKQLTPIIRNITLLFDEMANSGSGELLNDILKVKGVIKYGNYYNTISEITGLLYIFVKDTKLRVILDKVLGKSHCVSSVRDENLLFYKNKSKNEL